MLMFLSSCGNFNLTGGGSSSSSKGYAPTSIPSGKTLSGASVYFNFGYNSIGLTNFSTTLGYVNFVGTPSVTYTKTSDNSATLRWSATIYNDGRYSMSRDSYTETHSGNVTLYFVSPSEGYASGTEDGSSKSDSHFTLL